MHRLYPRLALRVLLSVVAITGLTGLRVEPSGAEARPRAIVVVNGTADERAMAEWAIGRFTSAGLELPAMEIAFHDDIEQCRGFIGLYSQRSGRLLVCNRGGRQTVPRHTMLHELAHAWSLAVLTADEIDRFNAARGVDAWIDQEGPWWLQGAEQAAEIVAWGLQDPADPYRSVWIHTEQCSSLAADFRLLTGRDPLNTSDQFCKPADIDSVDPAGVYGADSDREQVILEAIEAFGDAGLPLPDLRIYVHPTTAGCRDHPGLFNGDGRGDRIDLCTEGRFVLYHELAHAWDHHYLGDEVRRAFLEHTELPAWWGNDWGDNGGEMAANAIAAGLSLPKLSAGQARESIEELTRYFILTGSYSPRYPQPIPESRSIRQDDLAVAYAARQQAYQQVGSGS